jgi:hypothetical protein
MIFNKVIYIHATYYADTYQKRDIDDHILL